MKESTTQVWTCEGCTGVYDDYEHDERGIYCNECEDWFCLMCWQTSGEFIDDDENWVCEYCNRNE